MCLVGFDEILPRTILTTEYGVKNVMVFKAASPFCFRDCCSFFHRKKSTQNQPAPVEGASVTCAIHIK